MGDKLNQVVQKNVCNLVYDLPSEVVISLYAVCLKKKSPGKLLFYAV